MTDGRTIGEHAPRSAPREIMIQLGRAIFGYINRHFAKYSLVPTGPVLDPGLFAWAELLEKNWEAVRQDALIVLNYREQLPRFQDISPDQMRISPDDKWRTYFFYGFGSRSEQNCQFCPTTANLLSQVPGIETAFFSILAPGKVIPTHQGITNGLIRAHLGLFIPADGGQCFMDVGGVRCTWEEGKLLMFDDTYAHGVSNLSSEERIVLLFDFARPMRRPGRIIRGALFWVFRQTAYVKDALRNEALWSRRHYEVLDAELSQGHPR